MWGRLSQVNLQSLHQGNTPTHVGKTIDINAPIAKSQKHPHACGEDRFNFDWETPPRMWGRRDDMLESGGNLRNTPTHVGKTNRFFSSHLYSWKHPHACGEDFKKYVLAFLLMETPPRMWGRPN